MSLFIGLEDLEELEETYCNSLCYLTGKVYGCSSVLELNTVHKRVLCAIYKAVYGKRCSDK